MKLTLVLAVASLFFSVGTAGAASRGKLVLPLVNPDSLAGSALWNNDEVEGSYVFNRCRTRIKINSHGSSGLPGKDIVCLLSSDSYSTTSPETAAGSTAVFRGTIDATTGKLDMRSDDRAVACGLATPTISLQNQMQCFEDTGWNAALRCTNSTGIWLPANTLPGTGKYNGGAQIGVCAGLTSGFRMTPPAGELLSETGLPIRCKKCS